MTNDASFGPKLFRRKKVTYFVTGILLPGEKNEANKTKQRPLDTTCRDRIRGATSLSSSPASRSTEAQCHGQTQQAVVALVEC